jgi:hypothetical protein
VGVKERALKAVARLEAQREQLAMELQVIEVLYCTHTVLILHS